MAIIAQKSLVCWRNIECLGDLARLMLVLEHLPDEELMRTLEAHRGNGRNKYPVRAIWNSLLAGVVYQHSSIESLRRELLRNGQLRDLCGFEAVDREDAVPTSWAYTRFLKLLMQHQAECTKIFHTLVHEASTLLPGFGTYLAMDGKFIDSHGKKSKFAVHDGRREVDAKYGIKKYSGTKPDGGVWESVKKCFGFQLNLLIDASYELPVSFSVTSANASEIKQVAPVLDTLRSNNPGILATARYFIADKGYDAQELHQELWRMDRIKAIIDIRNLWKDGEKTKPAPGFENIVYDHRGKISCVNMFTGKIQEMAYAGFEHKRDALKYRCPAKEYGYTCSYSKECDKRGAVRIKRKTDYRIFSQKPRSSPGWEKIYHMRSAVERVNSRLDVSYGFEQHFIRGQKKMELRVSIAMMVMLAMAMGHVKSGHKEKLRSLVQTA